MWFLKKCWWAKSLPLITKSSDLESLVRNMQSFRRPYGMVPRIGGRRIHWRTPEACHRRHPSWDLALHEPLCKRCVAGCARHSLGNLPDSCQRLSDFCNSWRRAFCWAVIWTWKCISNFGPKKSPNKCKKIFNKYHFENDLGKLGSRTAPGAQQHFFFLFFWRHLGDFCRMLVKGISENSHEFTLFCKRLKFNRKWRSKWSQKSIKIEPWSDQVPQILILGGFGMTLNFDDFLGLNKN